MPKYEYSDGKGGMDVPDSGTPYGSCSWCHSALYLVSDGRNSTIKCPKGHSFKQIYNWGGFNDQPTGSQS